MSSALLKAVTSQIQTIWTILQHSFTRSETVEYPEQKPYLAPRYRGRIVLTKDPDGDERCVACNLCAVACPVDCIALQQGTREDGRWYPDGDDRGQATIEAAGLDQYVDLYNGWVRDNLHRPMARVRAALDSGEHSRISAAQARARSIRSAPGAISFTRP